MGALYAKHQDLHKAYSKIIEALTNNLLVNAALFCYETQGHLTEES